MTTKEIMEKNKKQLDDCIQQLTQLYCIHLSPSSFKSDEFYEYICGGSKLFKYYDYNIEEFKNIFSDLDVFISYKEYDNYTIVVYSTSKTVLYNFLETWIDQPQNFEIYKSCGFSILDF